MVSGLGARTVWSAVSQSGVTGAGTEASPYTVTTVANAAATATNGGVVEVNGNTIYRVRVGPMSKEDASSLCSKLGTAVPVRGSITAMQDRRVDMSSALTKARTEGSSSTM